MASKITFAKNIQNRRIESIEHLNDIVIEAQAAKINECEQFSNTITNVDESRYADNYVKANDDIINITDNAKVRSVEDIIMFDASVADNNKNIYVPREQIIEPDIIEPNNAEVRSVKQDASVEVEKYESRSLSWLRFNKRILELAKDQTVPLFERLKYLSITESNLDEFNMVRLPKLLSGEFENDETSDDVLNYKEYKMIKSEMTSFIKDQHSVHKLILAELANEGFIMIDHESQLTKKELSWTKRYFDNKIFSMLTPMVYDNMRPFQVLRNGKCYIGLTIKGKMEHFGTVEVPAIGDRLIEIKSCEAGKRKFILKENLIKLNLHKLFIGKKVDSKSIFRVLKSTNYEVGSPDEIVVQSLERKLTRNEHGDVMRIDLVGDKENEVKSTLKRLIMDKHTIFNKVHRDAIDLGYMMQFSEIELTKEESSKFRYPEFRPRVSDNLIDTDLCEVIKDSDIILHHPYEPYQTVIDFINQAADDEQTLCIKQTLYRVSKDSPIVAALVRAAKRGVMVTVVCEVKARFDEINNIAMAREIEKAGGQVVYGVNNLKIHSKMCMVVKSTNKGNLVSYVHIGTGNYNEKTSKIYTDVSYFTSRSEIVRDVESIFNSLTGFNKLELDKIFCSPNGIANELTTMIDKEIYNASKGIPAYINIKVNGLTDKIIIDKLYAAADAGVKVTLIVRGMCTLTDTRSNITVKSIVGRFLEHSRIYEFANNGDSKIFISSADLMERNLYNRVELLVPMLGKARKKVTSIMKVYMQDTTAFYLTDGSYTKQPEEPSVEMISVIDNNANDDQKPKKKIKKHILNSQELFTSRMRVMRKVSVHKFDPK